MPKILLIVSRRYNERELMLPLKEFRARGYSFEVVSTAKLIQAEAKRQAFTLKRTVYEVDSVDGFDGLMMVSGNPADTEAYWHDDHVRMLVEDANDRGLVIAAICYSVPSIRWAAKGKTVSFYPIIRAREELELAGAILSKVSLSVDDNLVTAENEQVTQMWAENFCACLEGDSIPYVLEESPFEMPMRNRKPDQDLERLKTIQHKTGKVTLDE